MWKHHAPCHDGMWSLVVMCASDVGVDGMEALILRETH